MRRLLTSLAVAALLLSGCWSRIEINDLGAVISLSIDRGEDGLLDVTLGVAQPGAASTGKTQPGGAPRRARVILRRRGTTIAEAIRLIELASPRRIALDHVEVVLLGERLVLNDLDSLLDYLLRNSEVRLSARVVFVQGTTPHEVVESTPVMRATQAEALREMESERVALMVTLKDLFIARSTPHISPIISAIRQIPHQGEELGATDSEIVISGAVVLKEGTGVLTLDQDQLRSAMFLVTDARDAVLTVPCPEDSSRRMSVRVNRARRNMAPVWDGRRLSFAVGIRADANLMDVQCHLDLTAPDTLRRMETELNKALARRLTSVLSETQAHEVDPFKFGEAVRVKYPALWREIGDERWLRHWRTVSVQIRPDIRLVHINMNVEPPDLKATNTKE